MKIFSVNVKTEKLHEKNEELYSVKTQLEEEKEKSQSLQAALRKDHTNSSIPSSRKPNHKPVPNSRKKTDKKRGGQKGHLHQPRKKTEPTCVINIPAPDEYASHPELFSPTGKEVTKQVVRLHVGVEVVEYRTPQFRNVTTGQRVHADFPGGLKDEVTYDGTVKAAAYLLNNECNVSIKKTRDFLKESYTLFLDDPDVEPTNNVAERLARVFKRKAAQVMCFRSQSGVNNYCDGMSIIQMLKAKGSNLYESAVEIFNR